MIYFHVIEILDFGTSLKTVSMVSDGEKNDLSTHHRTFKVPPMCIVIYIKIPNHYTPKNEKIFFLQ